MKDIKLIAFDLDGTLLTDDKRITGRTRRAIEAALARGLTVMAATGRPRTALPACVTEIEGLRYFMCSNGAVIWDAKEQKNIRQSYLSREQVLLLLSKSLDVDVWREICVDGIGYAQKDQFSNLENYVDKQVQMDYLRTTRREVESLSDYVMQCVDRIERVSFFSMYYDRLDTIRPRLDEIPEIQPTFAMPEDLEIGHATASKGRAIAYMADYLDIDPQEILSFGDGHNDIDLIEIAGVGVAMGNADDVVKASADIVTDSNEEDGVAKIIEQFLDSGE